MTIEELRRRWDEQLVRRAPCERCDSTHVWWNGLRLRKASLWIGDRTEFVSDVPVRRLKCGDCRWRWSLVPEGLSDHRHYQPCVVAHALAADALDPATTSVKVAAEHGCHVRTLWRWVVRVAALVSGAVLARRLAEESGTPMLPQPPEVRARRTARREDLAKRSVETLALLDALASHRGLTPPGLSHARHLVPADAGRATGGGGAGSGG